MEQRETIAIRLTEWGGFKIDDGKGVIAELGFDPLAGVDGWCVSVMDTAGRSLLSEAVPTLDIGLDRLAMLGSATESGLRDLYRVELPGGASFQRPGTVPADEILGKFGFSFVSSVRAFLVASLDAAFSATDAHLWFREKLGVLAPLQGSVDLVETGPTETCWCTDVLLPANGFYRPEDLLQFATDSVGACGVEMFSEVSISEDELLVATAPGRVVQFALRAAS